MANVPDADLKAYRQMLPNNPEGIDFLFSSRLSEAVQVPAQRVAIQYQITKENVIEELRRLLVIKAFTIDKYATKISPTPLSMHNPNYLPDFILTRENSGRALACHHPRHAALHRVTGRSGTLPPPPTIRSKRGRIRAS